ncbi:hypothetical protein L2K70_06670 [Nocardioides KLBMP 9356]|uniref:Uncharacterized protein n=1 Tax=Nocardioides potassii TaxID=2911371 RepID=A0ABS9HAK1_9ACTN|nr:hypothetical protein [Nocardioides potassii]MCF6377281.1 hypothetical protein [Nocardioides potassii]
MTEARDVGPLAEEAAKLVGALSGWAREHAAEAGHGLSDLADQAASAVHGLDEHLATGAAECTVCPLCRTARAVRQIDPEVTTHLASAFSSLVQAASVLLGTPVPTRAGEDVEDVPADDARPEKPDAR